MTDIQLMSVCFEELESGIPAVNFCSDFTVPITNKTFARSFITFYENDLWFRLGNLSANKLSFKVYDEAEGILEVYFTKEFMGYVLCGELYNAFVKVHQTLAEAKDS